jgi:fatty acid elongase 3
VFGGSSGLPVYRFLNLLLILVSIRFIHAKISQSADGNAGFVYFAAYTYFVSSYWPWIPNAGRCAGEEFAAFSGCAILSSYLFLFISFYFSTYKSGKRATNKAVTKGGEVEESLQSNGNGTALYNSSAKKNNVRSRKA